MHHQPTPHDALAQAILALLTEDHPGRWSLDELDRTLTPDDADRTAEAVADLHGAGLVHRCGEFVFATRAAHAAQRLAG
jgi:hypothetical protein